MQISFSYTIIWKVDKPPQKYVAPGNEKQEIHRRSGACRMNSNGLPIAVVNVGSVNAARHVFAGIQ
jgi:hypothetical protein